MIFFSTVTAAQKGVKSVITKGGSILNLGLFSFQLRRPGRLGNLDLSDSNCKKKYMITVSLLRCFGENIL